MKPASGGRVISQDHHLRWGTKNDHRLPKESSSRAGRPSECDYHTPLMKRSFPWKQPCWRCYHDDVWPLLASSRNHRRPHSRRDPATSRKLRCLFRPGRSAPQHHSKEARRHAQNSCTKRARRLRVA